MQIRSSDQVILDIKVNEIIFDNIEIPQPDFYLESNSVCFGESIQLFNISTGINLWWEWNVEGQDISYQENPIYIFDEIGWYDVSLSIFDLDGDLSTMSMGDYIHVSLCLNGDINMDDEVNVIDVIVFVNLILNSEYNDIADLNLDLEINVLDILLLITIILED